MIDSTDQGSGLLYAFAVSKDWDTSFGAFDMFASVTLAAWKISAMERHPLQRRTTLISRRLTGRTLVQYSSYETETAVKFG